MRFLNVHRVAGHRVFAPNVNVVTFVQADLKRTVSFDRPNRSERVYPGSHQCRLTSFLKHCASRKQREADNNQSKRDSFVHGNDAVQVDVSFQERITTASLLINRGV